MPAGDIIGHAEQALRRLNLSSVMHEPVETLSGGQKQLLAAAGALAVQSPLLLFDEATSMLDSTSAMLLLEQARSLHRDGHSIVWVTQKVEELAAGDRVIALRDGKISWEGETEAFFGAGRSWMARPVKSLV